MELRQFGEVCAGIVAPAQQGDSRQSQTISSGMR